MRSEARDTRNRHEQIDHRYNTAANDAMVAERLEAETGEDSET